MRKIIREKIIYISFAICIAILVTITFCGEHMFPNQTFMHWQIFRTGTVSGLLMFLLATLLFKILKGDFEH